MGAAWVRRAGKKCRRRRGLRREARGVLVAPRVMQKKRLIFLAGGAAILIAAGVALLWGPDAKAAVTRVMELLREAGPGVFFGAMAVLPLFGFPLAPFTLAAGPVFGPRMGAAAVITCAVAAVTINVALAYWISARALRPAMAKVFTRLGWKVPEGPVRSALELTLLLRVVPGIPFFVQSYLLGMARVPFGLYMAISVGVPAGYIVATILAGDALGRGDHGRLAAAGVVCAVAGAGLHYLRKRITRRMRERREAAAAGNTAPGNSSQ